IDPYQIGRDNPEALSSGAFYFYYRLGFRPRDAAIRRLALEERRKIERDAGYRSPRAVLEQLARSAMSLSLAPRSSDDVPISAARLAGLVTSHIAHRFDGNRRAASRAALTRVTRALGVRRVDAWPREERAASARLGLPFSLIPSLDRWPARDRRRLVAVMRAKGGASEARYVRLLAAHPRLRRSLAKLIQASGEQRLTSAERKGPIRAR